MLASASSCSVFKNPVSGQKPATEKVDKTKKVQAKAKKDSSKKKKTTAVAADKKSEKASSKKANDKKSKNNSKVVVAAKKDTASVKPEVVLGSTDVKAIQGEWFIRNVNGQDISGDNRPYLFFDTKALRFYGSNGCNILNGDFISTSQNELTLLNVATSMRSCEKSTTLEYLINNALVDIHSYKIKSNGDESTLYLISKGGRTLMTLCRHNIGYVNGAWNVKSINGEEIDNEKIRFIIDVNEHRIHGYAGCNLINGEIFVDPDKGNSIQFQNIKSQGQTCPDIAVESNLLVALEEIEHCSVNNEGDLILTSNDGNAVIVLSPIEI